MTAFLYRFLIRLSVFAIGTKNPMINKKRTKRGLVLKPHFADGASKFDPPHG